MLIDYIKPPLTYKEQLYFLKENGFEARTISSNDIEITYKLIGTLGFQTILKYAYFFINEAKKNNDKIYFSELNQLAYFDLKLKGLLFERLTFFELQFKERWSYHLSHEHGIRAYKDESLYQNKILFYQTISRIFQDIEKSKDYALIQKKNKYAIETLPNYVVKDVMTFGQLSKHYGNFKIKKTNDLIAKDLGFDNGEFCKSWLQNYVEVRNIIAHHGILWNRDLVFKAILPRKNPEILVGAFNHHSRKLYNTLTMLHFKIRDKNEDEDSELKSLLLQHPQFLPYMGFPPDWESKPIWQKETP